ncbi:hypothetical protein ACQRIU_001947 [Beauveria bassiana]
MKPHPSTPTPRRFLTKRPASSQLLPHSTPTPMRFQSTPRFGSTQSATRQMEDVEEVDDDVGASSQSSQSSANNNKKRPRSDERDMALLNSIEVDLSCAEDSLTSREERRSSSSSSSEHDMDEDDGDERRSRGDGYASDGNEVVEENGVTTDNVHAELIHGHEEEDTPKPVKRRRLSSASTSPTEQHMVVAAAYDSDTGGHHHEQDDDWAQDDDDDDDEDDVQDKTRRTRVPAQQQQPTFQPAPRFKPAPEDEPSASGGQACTAAIAPCSPPPRRGAKYLVNGLASQLQGLLSKVKGVVETRDDDDDDGGGPAGEFVARVLVEEVRLGARMHLVRGRVLSRGSAAATAAAAAESDEVVARCYMLAGGGGRGGAGARMVKQGSVLRVMPAPAWNVHLGEEEWAVACDWSVESMES